MTGHWQIHLFVPEASAQPWQSDEVAEAWARAHGAWLTAGPTATLGWLGFRMGASTAESLADEVERWARETGEDALLSCMADLRDVVSPPSSRARTSSGWSLRLSSAWRSGPSRPHQRSQP